MEGLKVWKGGKTIVYNTQIAVLHSPAVYVNAEKVTHGPGITEPKEKHRVGLAIHSQMDKVPRQTPVHASPCL